MLVSIKNDILNHNPLDKYGIKNDVYNDETILNNLTTLIDCCINQNADSLYVLGYFYSENQDLDNDDEIKMFLSIKDYFLKDYEISNRLLKESLDLGFLRAASALGDNYMLCGMDDEAVKYYELLSDQEDVHALTRLCHYYHKVKNDAKVAEYMKKLSLLGDSAKTALSYLYFLGIGTPKDDNKVLELLNEASKNNEPLAMLNLAEMYLEGFMVEKDVDKAFEIYKKLANDGNNEAMFALYNLYSNDEFSGHDLNKALDYLEKAAMNNNSTAMVELGLLYYKGDSFEKNDTLAFYWIEKAAMMEEYSAFELLSEFYLEGIGTDKDENKALYWNKKAELE